jgi:N-acetylmuramoyl-L-alanine amidase
MALQKLATVGLRPRFPISPLATGHSPLQGRQAAVGLRPRFPWRIALAATMVLAAAGCGQRRQSYRPIFATPAAPAPCTNCAPGTTGTTEDPGLPPASAVPVVPGAGGTESTVPPLNAPSGAGSSSSSSSGPADETPPRSRITDEPGLNDVSPTSKSNRGGSSPPAPPRPLNPSTDRDQRPSLESPQSGSSSSNGGVYDGRQTSASAPSNLRTASLKDRLRPFLDEGGTNELYFPNKADRPWRYIVLHHSAAASGSYDKIDREHRKILGFDGCGYHFVIGNGTDSDDGKIEVARRWNDQKQGVHCRNARTPEIDEYGIGICLVGNFEQEPPTPRQIAATQALIAYLKQRYNVSQTRVTTHSHLAVTPTVCPGRYFPTESILAGTSDPPARRAYRTSWTAVPGSGRAN